MCGGRVSKVLSNPVAVATNPIGAISGSLALSDDPFGDLTEGITGARATDKAKRDVEKAGNIQAAAQMQALAQINQYGSKGENALLAGLGGSIPTAALAQAQTQQQALLGLGGDSTAAYNAILNSPQFQAQLQAAESALGRQNSALGRFFSGGQVAGIQNLNAQLAGNAIQQQLSNLSSYQQQTQQPLNTLAGLYSSLGGSAASAITGAANAQANALINQAQITQQQAAGNQQFIGGLIGSGASLLAGGS
jgi:hypothetical protein